MTFDATDSDVVSISGDTLTFNNHRFVTGQKVTYNDGGGTAIGGLADGSYFIIKEDQNTIKLHQVHQMLRLEPQSILRVVLLVGHTLSTLHKMESIQNLS